VYFVKNYRFAINNYFNCDSESIFIIASGLYVSSIDHSNNYGAIEMSFLAYASYDEEQIANVFKFSRLNWERVRKQRVKML